ncbi:MAG: response regulator [Hyphomonadaceae bacterium]
MVQRNAFAALDLLIVDDNAHMRQLIKTVLRAAGVHRIREAGDGKEALELLAVRPADVILVDHLMAPMDGVEFVRRLRRDPNSPAPFARVIMVTGYGEKRHVTAARDNGADEFLVKPITAVALMRRIEAVIARGRAFIETDQFLGPDRRRRLSSEPPAQERRRQDEITLPDDAA